VMKINLKKNTPQGFNLDMAFETFTKIWIHKTTEIKQLTEEIEHKNLEIRQILSSRSWRYTQMFRTAANFLKYPLKKNQHS
jgi:IS1 family transposase